MRQLFYSLTVTVIFLLFSPATIFSAEREMKVGPVPLSSDQPRPLDIEAKEHAEAKKKFLEELEAEAKIFKMTIAAIQDPETKKAKEQEFKDSRKEKIKKFLDEEKRREEMKRDVDQVKKHQSKILTS